MAASSFFKEFLMAFHCSLVVFALVAAIFPIISCATEFIVGDAVRWKLGIFLNFFKKEKKNS